jgi:hypothetical protein
VEETTLRDLVAIDFFLVSMPTFRLLFVFVVLRHDRRDRGYRDRSRRARTAKSPARPGGNVTGHGAVGGIYLEPKLFELLKETVPKASRVAVLYPTPWLEGRPIATAFTVLSFRQGV